MSIKNCSEISIEFRPWSARHAKWLAPVMILSLVAVALGAFSYLDTLQSMIPPYRTTGIAPLFNGDAPTVTPQEINVVPRGAENR